MIENKVLKLLQKTITTLMCFWMLTTQMPINVVFADEINTEENIVEDINEDEDQIIIEEDVETINKEEDENIDSEIIEEVETETSINQELIDNINNLLNTDIVNITNVDELTNVHDDINNVIDEYNELSSDEQINIDYDSLLSFKYDVTKLLIDRLVESLPSEDEINTFDDVQKQIAPTRKLVRSTIPNLISELNEEEQENYNNQYNSLLSDITTWLVDRQKAIMNGGVVSASTTYSYTLLDYIDSDGKAYIKTGYKHNTNTKVETKVKIKNESVSETSTAGWAVIYGSKTSGDNQNALVIGYNIGGTTGGKFFYNIGGKRTDTDAGSYNFTTDYKFEFGNNLYKVNDGSNMLEGSNLTQKYEDYIFADNVQNTLTEPSKIRLYYLKINDSNGTQRDYVPAKRNDGAVGLFDLKNSKFYENAGEGSFKAGSDTGAILIYDANGHGTAPSAVTMKYSTATNVAKAISATGYTFNGWNTKADGTGTTYDAGAQFKAANVNPTPTTLYAKWTKDSYNISYDLAGGSVSTANKTFYDVETATFTLNNPTRIGYTFAGWTGSNGTTPQTTVTIAKGSTGNKSYTANWTAKSSTISLDGNGATSTGHTTSTTATYGSAMPYITLPTRTGYKLLGYFDAQEDGTKYYNSENSDQSARNWDKEDANVTLYAQWEPSKYIITLNRDGAISGSTSVTATYNSVLPKISNLPSKVGYTFDGYYTGSNGTGTKYYDENGTSSRIWTGTSNLTLYANWILSSYKITFNKNGGNGGTDEIGITYNETMPSISVPTKDGYTFDGYYDGESTETKYYNADGSPAVAKWNKGKSATLYAHWSVNSSDMHWVAYITPNANNEGNSGTLYNGLYYYDNFVTAIDDIKDGQTVTLLQNIELTDEISLNRTNITIDLNSKILSGRKDANEWRNGDIFSYDVNNLGKPIPTITIKNGTIKYYWQHACALFGNYNVTSINVDYLLPYNTGLTEDTSNDTSFIEGRIDIYGGSIKLNRDSIPESGISNENRLIKLVRGNNYSLYVHKNTYGGSEFVLESTNIGTGIVQLEAGKYIDGIENINQYRAPGYVGVLNTGADSNIYKYVVVEGWQIDFNSNGGSEVDTQYIEKGSKVTKPTDPAKDNYIFDGWYTDNKTFENKWNFDNDIPTKDTILYAKWLEPVASVNHNDEITIYTSLQDAFDAADSGDTVTLLVNQEVSSDLTIPENVTLTFNDGTCLTINEEKTLLVNGTLLMPESGYVPGVEMTQEYYNSVHKYLINNGTLEIGATGTFKSNHNNCDIVQRSNMKINAGAKVYLFAKEAGYAIGPGAWNSLDSGFIIHHPNTLLGGYDYDVYGDGTLNYQAYNNDGFVIKSGTSTINSFALYDNSRLQIKGGTVTLGAIAQITNDEHPINNSTFAISDAAKAILTQDITLSVSNRIAKELLNTSLISGDISKRVVEIENKNAVEDVISYTYSLQDLIEISIPTAITGLTYNGLEQTGVIEGIGYKLTNNTATNADTYTATAKLDAGYIWSDNTIEDKNITFTISQLSISNAEITLDEYDKYYCGTPITPSVTSVKVGDITLNSTDYEVIYFNNELTDATVDYSYNEKDAIAKVTAKDNSNFAGSKEVTYRIKRKEYSVTWNLNDGHLEAGVLPTIKYYGKAITIACSPSKEGYHFVNYVDQDDTKYKDGNQILANKDLVLDAIYEVDPYSDYWVARVDNVINETSGVKGKDNSYYFTSFTAALNEAVENLTNEEAQNSTVTLLKDVELVEPIKQVPNNVIIDLNNKKISSATYSNNSVSDDTKDVARIFYQVDNSFSIKNGTLENRALCGYAIFTDCKDVKAYDINYTYTQHNNSSYTDPAQIAAFKTTLEIYGGSVEGNYVLTWTTSAEKITINNSDKNKFFYKCTNYVKGGSPSITINGGLYATTIPSNYVNEQHVIIDANSEDKNNDYNFEVVEGGKITFANEGTLPSGYSNSTIYTKESGISLPTPTRNEYVFDGWYTDSDLSTKVTNTTSFGKGETGPKTLYAKWITVIEAAVAKIKSNDRLTYAVGFENGYSYYDTLANAIKDATSTETNVTLLKDVAEHDLTINANQNVTLNLNGKTIDANHEGRLFINKGTLTINDFSSEHAGKLINGRFNGTIGNNNDSAGNGIRNEGTLNINGGTISGCTNTTTNGTGRGGAIFTTGSGSVVNFAGGSITNSNALYGGAIYVTEESSLLMSETATISGCDNIASDWGGGAIHIYKASATINNGTISNCTSSNRAGAIYVHNSTLTINNVLINNCTATNGGQAIEVDCTDGNSTIAINGGTIKCNDSTKELIVIEEEKNNYTITNNITGGWYSRYIIPNINYGIYKSNDEEHKEAPYTVTSNYYTITYNSNGGSNIDPEKIYSLPGYSVKTRIMNEVPTKQGYKFSSWNTESNGTGTRYVAGDEITLTGDITLYAQWEEDVVTVYLHSKANISGTDISAVGQLTRPEKITKNVSVDIKAKEDIDSIYRFDHWEIDGENVGNNLTLSYAFTKDVTDVYAVFRYELSNGIKVHVESERPFTMKVKEKQNWLLWTYNVDATYVVENDDNGIYDKVINVVPGSQVELIYANTNNDFVAWTSEKGVVRFKEPTYLMNAVYVEQDIRLQAKEEIESKHYVKFVNNDDQILKTCEVESLEELKSAIPDAPGRLGYKFVDWSINDILLSELTNDQLQEIFKESDVIEIRATFEKLPDKYKVIANTVVGDVSSQFNVDTDEYALGDVAYLSAPKVEDYVFAYWTIDGEIVSYNEKYEHRVLGNITISANYQKEVVEKQVTLTASVATGGSQGNEKIAFTVTRSVPEDMNSDGKHKYSVVENGILYSSKVIWTSNYNDSDREARFKFDSVDEYGNVKLTNITKVANSSNSYNGNMTGSFATKSDLNKVFYIRGYIIVECDNGTTSGVMKTIYTDLYKVTYNTIGEPNITPVTNN